MYRRGPFWGGPYMRRRGFPLLSPLGGLGLGLGMGGGSLITWRLGSRRDRLLDGEAVGTASTCTAIPTAAVPGTTSTVPATHKRHNTSHTISGSTVSATTIPTPTNATIPAITISASTVPATSGRRQQRQLSQLKLLGHLRDTGLLTNDEFEAEKRKILQGY